MRRMNEESTGLLSIGEFARRSNLSISALRFYGDCGVLAPARTDNATGYRDYSVAQLAAADLIRHLRALEMPIVEIQSFLTADHAGAEALLEQHWKRLQSRLDRSRQALVAVQSLLRNSISNNKEIPMSATTSIPGSRLASAIRQVLPAAGPTKHDYPAAMLIDLREDGLRLVATNGHQLSVRDLPTLVEEVGSTVIGFEDARRLASMVEAADQVTLTTGRALSLVANGKTVQMSAASDHYPDYQAILDKCGHSTLLVKTKDLANLLGKSQELIVLSLSERETLANGVPFPGRYQGEDLRIGLNPAYLAEATTSGIGPDTLLQLGGPEDPVMVRSADDGTLTWMVMPIRLKEPAAI